MPSELRRFERSRTDSDDQLSFRCGGQWFEGIPIQTLSAGGCSFQAPEALVDLMDRLEVGTFEALTLRLKHTPLPDQPIRARVAYTLGRQPVIVGVEFLDVPPGLHTTLLHHVRALIQHQRSQRTSGASEV